MKRLAVAILVVLSMLAASAFAQAPGGNRADRVTASGKITAFEAGKLTIKGEKGDVVFTTNDKTKVFTVKEEKRVEAKIEDVKKDKFARVMGTKVGEVNEARNIVVVDTEEALKNLPSRRPGAGAPTAPAPKPEDKPATK